LALLKEAIPSASAVTALLNSANPASVLVLRELQGIAPGLSVRLQSVDIQRFQDFEPAFASIIRAGAEMLFVVQDPYVFAHRQRIVELAAEGRLPTMYMYREWADQCLRHVAAVRPPDVPADRISAHQSHRYPKDACG
jgi:putative ABC transport system substrate-binding protein